ncbi:MAG: hypothetical protein MRJ65_02570 [Candidatus Brocadiaceae bacterium]|nr:hypothetical protein [Candidatus Brocadiaceae bacterium]
MIQHLKGVACFEKRVLNCLCLKSTTYFPDSLPKEDWCYTYHDRSYPLINEDKFKHLYDQAQRMAEDMSVLHGAFSSHHM